MTSLLLRCAAAALSALSFGALAQYPAQSIKMLVPIPPGGGPDLVARIVGQKLSEVFRQPVVIENRPGSNGVIATEATARAAPDGYTLLLGPEGMIVINPHLYAKMPFDPFKDIAPVASVFRSNFVLAVNAGIPARTFQEFIGFARKASPPLSYASGGNGSQHQLIMELLKSRAGINLLHVPYKGGAPAVTAAVAGDVAVLFAGPSIVTQTRSGKLRALAVSGDKRSPIFPDLPSMGEFYPGATINPWAGLYAPGGTPKAVLARLHAEVNKVLAEPGMADQFDKIGSVEPYLTTAEELAALLQHQYAMYGKIVKDVGATID